MPYNPDTILYLCDGCSLWQHEQFLVTVIENAVMKTYFDSSKQDYKVIVINDEDRGEVTVTLCRSDQTPDESFSIKQESGRFLACV